MSAAVNSMIGAQSDSIVRGAVGSESGEESGSLESRVSQSAGLVLGSIAVGVAAPVVASNRPSSIGGVGPELRVGDDAVSAFRALFGARKPTWSMTESSTRKALTESFKDVSPKKRDGSSWPKSMLVSAVTVGVKTGGSRVGGPELCV